MGCLSSGKAEKERGKEEERWSWKLMKALKKCAYAFRRPSDERGHLAGTPEAAIVAAGKHFSKAHKINFG